MGRQPPVHEKEAEAVTEMETTPSHAREPEQLFERLAGLRRLIASEAGLSLHHLPYSTLIGICRALTKDMQELKAVQGVGVS